jgi:hypothetical protein
MEIISALANRSYRPRKLEKQLRAVVTHDKGLTTDPHLALTRELKVGSTRTDCKTPEVTNK